MDVNATMQEIIENLFNIGGDYDRSLELIEALADWIAGDGFKPAENTVAEWPDVLIGAYWFCVNYHSGMSSDEYRLQCSISHVYSPGPCEAGPEPDSSSANVYAALVELAGFDAETTETERTR